MLTSVKVQFGACLVDLRGNCSLAGPLIRRGGGGLQKRQERRGGMPKSDAVAELVFQLRRYTGLAVAEHFHGGREKRPNSREISSSSSDLPLNWKNAESALLAQPSAGPETKSDPSARTCYGKCTRPFYRRGMTLREARVGSANEKSTRSRCLEDQRRAHAIKKRLAPYRRRLRERGDHLCCLTIRSHLTRIRNSPYPVGPPRWTRVRIMASTATGAQVS